MQSQNQDNDNGRSAPFVRRATSPRASDARQNRISIHALREEGDLGVHNTRYRAKYFYPRPPRGGRLWWSAARCASKGISIHALREEGDVFESRTDLRKHNFYPRPPRGGRQYTTDKGFFQP